MEIAHVKNVYDAIAHQFDHTRYSIWAYVKRFLESLPSHSFVGDIGCGNGKNMFHRRDIMYLANDISSNLLNIVHNKNPAIPLLQANVLNLPHRNNIFDATLCIAVLHHISTPATRLKALTEIIRCTKPAGQILFTVWVREQPIKPSWCALGNGDYFVPWQDPENKAKYHNRYYHLFSELEISHLLRDIEPIAQTINITLEKHNYCVLLQKKGA